MHNQSPRVGFQGTAWHVAILIAASLASFFFQLGEPKLWDRDEPRNAGCAAEMLERGDWVVPIFNDQLRHQKPVLLYWLMMSAYQCFGVNEFSARFWSALLATGTVLSTYVIGRRLFDATTGLLAGVALASSMMFVVAARAATPDSVLIFCSTLALMWYVLGTFDRSRQLPANGEFFPRQLRYVIPMYLTMGLGVLAKGPVGFLLPMAMIGLFGLIRRLPPRTSRAPLEGPLWQRAGLGIGRFAFDAARAFAPLHFLRTLRCMRPLLAFSLIFGVALPWFVAVHLATQGDFTDKFFVGEHFQRTTQAMENHSGGLWFYPLAILLGFFPWSCFWGPTAIGLVAGKVSPDEPQASMNRVALIWLGCWAGVQVGAFSLAQTKLPSYVTPCYPALALMTAFGIQQFVRSRSTASAADWIHPGWYLAGFASLTLSGVLVIVGVSVGFSYFLPGLEWLAVLGVLPLLAGVLGGWWITQRRERWLSPMLMVTGVFLAAGLFGLGATQVDQRQKSLAVMDLIRSQPEGAVATYGCLESSWVFYAGKPITELWVGGQHADRWATREHHWEPIPRQTVQTFAGHEPQAMILTTTEHLEDLRQQVPNFEVVASTPYFLRNGQEIFLLAPPRSSIARSTSSQTR